MVFGSIKWTNGIVSHEGSIVVKKIPIREMMFKKNIADQYFLSFMPLVTSLFIAAVTFSLGTDRFSRDVEAMIGHPISKWWLICWNYLSPLMVLVRSFVLNLVPMQGFPFLNEGKHNKSSAQTVFGFVTRFSHERLLMRGRIA